MGHEDILSALASHGVELGHCILGVVDVLFKSASWGEQLVCESIDLAGGGGGHEP